MLGPIRANGPTPYFGLQPAFTAGELAPALYARTDLAKWHTGARTMRNFFVHAQGGASNRPGTQFVCRTKYPDRTVRLIPFVYNSDQTYILEFGDYYIRFIADGAPLMVDGVPFEVATPYAHNDLALLKYAQANDILTLCHPHYAVRELRRYGQTDWRLSRLTFGPTLGVPGNVTAAASGGGPSESAKRDYTYAVTAARLNPPEEGRLSDAATCTNWDLGYNGNYGTKNVISWNAVASADYYNVYRYYQGTWSFIGSTAATSMEDLNVAPDTTTTPPDHYDPFSGAGIAAITVTNGGSGYSPATQIIATDPTGSGAVLQPVIVNGVIRSVTVQNPGSGYTAPQLATTDPGAGGKGAVLTALVEQPGGYSDPGGG